MDQTSTRDLRLSGKVVLVTGAARGIGAGVGRLLSARGAQVVLSDLPGPRSGKPVAKLHQPARLLELDVTSESAWAQAIAAVLKNYQRIDALINCAGVLISPGSPGF